MEPWEISSFIFQHPFTAMICGPTQCGKTQFLVRLLEHIDSMIHPKIQNIIYCYGSWQPVFKVIQNQIPCIQFFNGLASLNEVDSQITNLVIFDDLMDECINNKQIQNLFTKDSHHQNISVIFVSQNLYAKGKFSRTMALNSHYLVLFKNPRDQSQISVLGRQMFPGSSRFLVDAFRDATEKKKHGYLFLDLKPNSDSRNRIQTNVITGDQRIIYTPVE